MLQSGERHLLPEACLLYDEQFNKKMKIAKFLVKNLNDKKGYELAQMEIAKKWLVRVANIKSPAIEVKKNRNAFLSYLIKVLGDGVLTRCLDSEPNAVCDPDNSLAFLEYSDDISSDGMSNEDESDKTEDQPKKIQFQKRWSKDYKTYVAVMPIPGRGALVYMAASKKPGLENWDLPNARNKN